MGKLLEKYQDCITFQRNQNVSDDDIRWTVVHLRMQQIGAEMYWSQVALIRDGLNYSEAISLAVLESKRRHIPFENDALDGRPIDYFNFPD